MFINLINKYGIMETMEKYHNSRDLGKSEFRFEQGLFTLEMDDKSIVCNRLISGNFVGLKSFLCSALK